jgi:NifU-like protein involved in Fe-S cluster formation
LEALTIYDNLHKQLNRINCGKVGIWAIEAAINKYQKK